MEKNLLLQPIDYTVAGAVCQGQQYIMVKAIDSSELHVSVMPFTAGKVVLESVGEKCADTYFSVEATPHGALVSYEERIVVGSRQYERVVDSTFFFPFSPERMEAVIDISMADEPVRAFYAAIGRPVPEWITSSDALSKGIHRRGILGVAIVGGAVSDGMAYQSA